MNTARKEYLAHVVSVANPSDDDLYAAQNGCCLACRVKINASRHSKENPLGYTRDHIFPRSQGNTLLGNKVLVCQPCNVQKGHAKPEPQYLHRALTLYMRLMSQDMIELLRRQAHPLFVTAPESRLILKSRPASANTQRKAQPETQEQAWGKFWRKYQQRTKRGVPGEQGDLYLVINKDNQILTRVDKQGRAYFAVGRPNDIDIHLCDEAKATARVDAYNESRPKHLPACKLVRIDHYAQSQQDRAKRTSMPDPMCVRPQPIKQRLRFTAL